MNKFLVLLVFVYCSCSNKTFIDNKLKYDIEGEWLMYQMIINGDPGHMVGPVQWDFIGNRCYVRIEDERVYNFKLKGTVLHFYPVKGYKYDEFEEKFIFNKFKIEYNEKNMLLTKINDHIPFQILYRKNGNGT